MKRSAALLIILLFLAGLSLLLGRYPEPGLLSPAELVSDPMALSIALNMRLPRILIALLLGASLGAAGLVFQTILGNPLVEPGFLGVSQGAAFGAALMILLPGDFDWAIPLAAGAFALGALVLTWILAKHIRFGGWVIRLILSGIVVSALFSSALGGLKYLADPASELREITFWMMGGLSGLTRSKLFIMAPFSLVPLILLFLFRWRLNLLSMGDRTARSLGVSPRWEKNLFLLAAVFATAAVVAYCGIIGWIGLIIPHIARRLFGSDTGKSLPGALLLGGIFALLCDDAARTVSSGEIPLGIITALLGALIFTALMVSSPWRRQL